MAFSPSLAPLESEATSSSATVSQKPHPALLRNTSLMACRSDFYTQLQVAAYPNVTTS